MAKLKKSIRYKINPQENIKNSDDVFVWIKKIILKGVFGFGSMGLLLFVTSLLAIKLNFFWAFLTHLNASELKN